MPTHEVIACDLRPDELALRQDSWRAVREQVEIVGRGSFRGGFRITFRASGEAIDAVERLVAAERVCCAWADWRLMRNGSRRRPRGESFRGTDRIARASVWRSMRGTRNVPPPDAAAARPASSEANPPPATSENMELPAWQAVIFDLWDTLVEFPWDLAKVHLAAMAKQLAVDRDQLRATWRELEPAWETMPLAASLELLCRELGVRRPDIEKLCDLRLGYMRQALKPRTEVIETLREVRARGLRVGLISACSGDVPLVWGKTPLADLVDVPVFSCVVGFCKPDPRIYRLASSELGVEESDCLYVGDGGHDELGGAARAGMTAVLLQPRGRPSRPEAGAWTARISAIPEVLRLL